MQTTTKQPTKREIAIHILQSKPNAQTEVYKGRTIIIYDHLGKKAVAVFLSKGNKPYEHYLFTEDRYQKFIDKNKQSADYDQDNKDRFIEHFKKETDNIQAGTILYSSWGYEQTNIDFYKVLSRKNDTVTLQQIGGKYDSENQYGDRGKCIADESTILSEPFKKRVTKYGIKLNSYSYCSLWDGQPKYWSAYA